MTDLASSKRHLRPDGHAVRVLLNVLHELLAPDASLDENESALAILEASVEYLQNQPQTSREGWRG